MDLPRIDRAQRRILKAALGLPPAVRRALFGLAPVSDRGIPLDPQLHTMLRLERLLRADGGATDVGEARRALVRGVAVVGGPVVEVARVEPVDLGGVACRRYDPGGPPGRPLVVWLHGGGWAAGDLDTHDGWCRRLAAGLGAVVVAADYRLAPEHPFPAGLEDARRVIVAAMASASAWGCDPKRVAVGGDSAGGNLAISASLGMRDAGERLPAALLLVYPATDLRRIAWSHQRFAFGFLLERPQIDRYLAWYGAPRLEDPRASVLLAPSVAGLPPTLLAVAGFDPLRDEGEQLAARLEAAGVPVTRLDGASLVHGYLQLEAVAAAMREADAVVDAARRLLA